MRSPNTSSQSHTTDDALTESRHRCIFDLETDGLLDTVTKVHSLVILTLETGELLSLHTPEELAHGIKVLSKAGTLIGHNILSFDIPVLEKLYNFTYPSSAVIDTLICSRLVYPDLKNSDFAAQRHNKRGINPLPPKLIGSHSLEAWGYRLGVYKDTFGKTTDWKEWSEEMQAYCEQDVRVTERLYEVLNQTGCSPIALELEHAFRDIINKQEAFGFPFNRGAAVELYGRLSERRIQLKDELQQIFPAVDKGELFVPKRDNRTMGYKAGVPVWKPKLTDFNPSSRQHIAERLMEKYGWQPDELTDEGKPKLDEEVLASLTFPECEALSEYLLLDKRLGQLADGAQAWLRSIGPDGRIHGQVNTNGAVTGRCTHHHPNIAQVPAVGASYGAECRALFTPPEGYVQLGCDASGLELRCLAHYLARYDGGAYKDVILTGDIHTANQKAAGLPDRNSAKRFIYSYIYGAGDAKVGSIIDPSLKDANAQAALGKKIKKRFLAEMPALAQLIRDVQYRVKTRNYLTGLDSRILPVRSEHSALNTLLQSAGAVIMKQATIFLWKSFAKEGFEFGREVAQMAHIHDEFQLAVRDDIDAEYIGELSVAAIRKAGEHLMLRCPLDGEYRVGHNWAETH